ncbi:MAG TPA: metalloregulator ArsR/SmtB family transcription factor [Planctomycetaceae bacterium]|nr:metalloregulator ArsR/SmtB family transcription factor [Planctomycetaceae bacterium]
MFEQFARVGRAVSAPLRLAILDVLAQSERTVEDIAREIGASVANASQHLRQLRSARLVASRRESLFIYYRLADDKVLQLWQMIREVGETRYAEIDEVVRTYLKERETMRSVDADELRRLIRTGDVVVLDVRPAVEFAAGHISGARSIPLSELAKRLRELPRRRQIVAYCRGPYCVLSDDAIMLLQKKKFRAARLTIGLPEWKLLGLPIES